MATKKKKPEGKSCPGSQHPRALLTPAKVVRLRKQWADGKITKVDIASIFGISYFTARRAALGLSYKDVPMPEPKAGNAE